MAESLLTKYRPQSFEEVIGNKIAIKNLEATVKSDSCPHAFLLTGPSGVGKTTTARIIAKQLNASIFEIDVASNSSVDDIRRFVEKVPLRPITVEPNVLYILDECQTLGRTSQNTSWQPLLKPIEDAPPFAYFAFCTTDAQKVPTTIKTRCYPVDLKPLKAPDIEELLEVVSELEGWKVENDVFQAIVQASEGSARRALSVLQAGHSCKSKDELSTLVAGVERDDNPALEIARHLVKGGRSWKQLSILLEKIEDFDEAVISITRYLAVAMTRSDEAQACDLWRAIRALSETSSSWDSKVKLYSGVGKILWGTEPF